MSEIIQAHDTGAARAERDAALTRATDVVDGKLQTHEAICAERYKNLQDGHNTIINRLITIEKVMIAMIGTLLIGAGGMITALILNTLHN